MRLVRQCGVCMSSSADPSRLVIYFPVSSLVTLFANILQNPQDPRARSDVRLMNLVVMFLSKLSNDEENMAVRRMLSICSEFERIATVVIDRAEKETSSKRKRKTADSSRTKDSPTPTPTKIDGLHPIGSIAAPVPAGPFSSSANVDLNFSPNIDSFTPGGDVSWMSEFSSGEVPSLITPTSGLTPGLTGSQSFSNEDASLDLGAFQQVQQPFVPPDLWQMLEWDWGEMTGMSNDPLRPPGPA